ncbi:MAG: hypothetical protein IJW71_04210 [Clostridia bacterium]|nr:hypothetical protein [Clostridia bacterium]
MQATAIAKDGTPIKEERGYWNLVDGYAAFAPQGDMTAGENNYTITLT